MPSNGPSKPCAGCTKVKRCRMVVFGKSLVYYCDDCRAEFKPCVHCGMPTPERIPVRVLQLAKGQCDLCGQHPKGVKTDG
jgi:hypothetical protein